MDTIESLRDRLEALALNFCESPFRVKRDSARHHPVQTKKSVGIE
jgi:hypothetical protein